MTETREGEYVRLFAASKQAFRFWQDSDGAGFTALTPVQRNQLAREVDGIFAQAITDYFPHFLPYCREPYDIQASLVGLYLIGEVEGIPAYALHFLGRGVAVAPLFAAEQPEEVRALLDSVGERGYPTNSDLRNLFFVNRGSVGKPTMCVGARSGVAIFQVLMDNEEKTKEIAARVFEAAG